MLIENITLSDYSDDELNKFINEAQKVLRDAEAA
nr:MAG TPA: L1 Poxvirus entry protein complex L1 and I2 [Caudoviricetes sp.]